jgi:hypothetical protein
MRTGYIKPEFFKDDELCELSPLARILFEGLCCLADDGGKLEYRTKRIKAEILPYDDCDIEELLLSLEPKFIYRNGNYIKIMDFAKFQNPEVEEGDE